VFRASAGDGHGRPRIFSAKNEREAEALGVKKVALPARGRPSAKRAQQQKQRWFRRGLRWRAGIEATMSTLKHPCLPKTPSDLGKALM
jgi:hypothetical protein